MLLGVSSVAFAQGAGNPFTDCGPGNGALFETMVQAPDGTHLTRFRLVNCNGTSIFADDVRIDDRTVFATGNVVVTQRDLRVNAERMEMDRATKFGTFYKAYGTATLSDEPADPNLFGSFEPQVWFHADKLERIGRRSYKLTSGVFSTCTQPNARWAMHATSGTVILDDHASLTNVQFRVKGVPILYIPYLYYPMKKDDRSTGILIPNYSKSALRGHGFSNAFFWAMRSNMDATLYHDFYSKSGQGGGAEYRYIASGQSGGNFKFYGFNEKERLAANGTTVERPAHTWYTFDGSLNQKLGDHFTLYGIANYFTDISSQQLYQQDVYDLTNRNRKLDFTLTGSGFQGTVGRRIRLTANFNQTDIFTGTTSQGRSNTPKINLFLSEGSLNRSKQGSKITYGGSLEVARFELRDPVKPTLSVRRMDASGTIRSPLSSYEWLSVNTSATGRLTEWLDTVDPLTGQQRSAPLTRALLDVQASVIGPRVSRVFNTPKNRYAEAFQHAIEPSVSIGWTSPFDRRNELIQVDYVDATVGGTTRIAYSLLNRIRARAPSPDGNGRRRDLLTVDVSQSYYSQAQAAAIDPLYSNASAGRFSPVQIRAQLSPADGVFANFTMSKNSTSWAIPGTAATDVAYNASTTMSIRDNRLNLTAGWSKTEYFTAAQGFVNLPTTHALYASTVVKMGGVGVTYGFNFDVPTRTLIQQRIGAYYRAQCCGIAFDYQERNGLLLTTVPTDRRFAVTFTLAGIGSFSPPLGGLGR